MYNINKIPSRVPAYQNGRKLTVSAISCVESFSFDWRRVWDEVEAHS
jgi:hypothetical protein